MVSSGRGIDATDVNLTGANNPQYIRLAEGKNSRDFRFPYHCLGAITKTYYLITIR